MPGTGASGPPLIRPSGTFSRKGRRLTQQHRSQDSLLPLREKVDRPKAETDEGTGRLNGAI